MVDTTDRRPVYITENGNTHRQLSECYIQGTQDHALKPLLILTIEEYEALIAAQFLSQTINKWRNQL